MMQGYLIVGDKKIEALYTVTENERTGGLNVIRPKDKVLVFSYCCPSYAGFKGCEDRNIDIAFCKHEGSTFRVVKMVSPLAAQKIVAVDNVTTVIEGEEGYLTGVLGLRTGSEFKLSVMRKGNVEEDLGKVYQTKRAAMQRIIDDLEGEIRGNELNPEAKQKIIAAFGKRS